MPNSNWKCFQNKFFLKVNCNILVEEALTSYQRNRPLFLTEKLGKEFKALLISLKKAGDTIKRHTVCELLIVFIKNNLEKNGNFCG